jgi:uncharacterized protein (DUF362 family)
MPSPRVALTRCSDYGGGRISEAIARQFELLGGVEKFVRRGESVLLKPNFIAPRSRRCATQTDPAVILEVAKLLKDFGAKPLVGDSPAWSNVFACVKALRLEEALKRLSVPVRALNKPKKCRIGRNNPSIGISSVALEADVIINLPKFKTHQQLMATFAVKNMFGCVSGKWKTFWHFAKGKRDSDFCQLLIEVFRYLEPALTIIDAVTVMDGPGPIRGRARPLGYLIGGTEPMAMENVCCKLVNIKPEDLPIIRTARQIGFDLSEPDEIEVLGDDLPESVCMDFELPELIPIRFSLLHLCKSICKQMLLLARAAVKRLRF